ncbi:MAG TPA: Asp-tRNA(Asn)/Glu-tRNA(Gln) amidotransferase subunit GatC [Nitrososphaeraceae archaeon]|nr:Asp-tRNA(Asn)/Glu-tRNA(Gln) amidotransferase subunit GatC [Nitrososphaeraceae archaeon]
MITKDELKHLSKLSKIELSQEEYETYLKQIEKIVGYLDKLDAISLNEMESYSMIKKISDLREDKVNEFDRDIQKVIKNKKDKFVRGPQMN